uniref:Dynamin-type G domain-containing protein n=1 Tax=Schistocephalus solidus TaxID=70667 RepID=A0A0X3PID4_SCHSO
MADQLIAGNAGARSRNLLLRKQSHSNLIKFKEAKQQLQNIFLEIESYVKDCQKFFDEKLPADAGNRLSPALERRSEDDINPYYERVKHIQEIIARNQMKCAFFGRTSNGKSTVINAMLGSRILPAGIGHTTSCFVQIEGTDQSQGFTRLVNSTDTTAATGDSSNPRAEVLPDQPIESVSQLAHALSSDKLATDSLVCLYWPNANCHLLREDVVLLDSPGVNVDPDMDRWIDQHCLDADVFILVANAESTLMQAEKDFFHRVSSKISKPNIFILNNRWDASAGEVEYADQVKEQHLQRCVSFLADELKVCGRDEAMERVFFVSAREVLTVRAKSSSNCTPPGAAPNIGLPSAGGYPLAEGWQARLLEFSTFEKVFEKILSDSATRTKFAAHTEQGKELAAHFRGIMETTYEAALEEKDAAIRYRRLSESRLEELRTKLQKASQAIEELISKCLIDVEGQVANALCSEIRRLNELVDNFDRPFSSDPSPLQFYKRDLNAFIERELGRKLGEACAGDIHSQVVRAEQFMAGLYASLVPEESSKNRIMQSVLAASFEPEFHVDCRNICAEFREDLSFRFSLGLSTLAQKLFHSPRERMSWAQGYAGSPSHAVAELSPVLPAIFSHLPSLLGRNTVGLAVVGGFILKAAGWRVIFLCAGLYAGLYAYERLTWTSRAREEVFKRQYVAYASHKLRLIVDLTGTNARHQVKRELQQIHRRLAAEGEDAATGLARELDQLDSDIVTLNEITVVAKTLKNNAVYLDSCLNKFNQDYINTTWT